MKVQTTILKDAIKSTILSINPDLSIEFCNLGASVTKIFFSNKFKNIENITLMPEKMTDWLSQRTFAGSIVGPLAGRYETTGTNLEQNRPPLHFHGGSLGMDQWIWKQKIILLSDKIQLTFSKKMESLDVKVVYTLTKQNQLILEIFAQTQTQTFFNPTNHLYFNLNGNTSKPVTNHQLSVSSDEVCLESKQQVINSQKKLAANDFLNFSNEKSLALLENYGGLDTTFLFGSTHLGTLFNPENGRKITITSTLPAAVIFTFNKPQPAFTKGQTLLPAFSGITFETQFPANQLDRVRLSPERPYYSKTTYQFTIVE